MLSNNFDPKEACDHQLNPTDRFGDLPVGVRFRFPGSQQIHTRTKSGYRDHQLNRVFKTGSRVAVIRTN